MLALSTMLNFKKQTLLIISPHPDDEVLGCGGLIKRVKDEGGKVYVLFLTVGVTLDNSKTGISTGHERVKEIENVAKYLKFDDYRIAFFGDDFHLKLDKIPQKDMMNEIENGIKISLNTIKPTIVTTPIYPDYNQDHRVCTEAVLAATRPAPVDTKPFQKVVLGYESVPTANWWNTNAPNLNFYLSLKDEDLKTKLTALKLYRSQIRNGAHPRSTQSMKNLAHYRGIESGASAAEAFFTYRMIV